MSSDGSQLIPAPLIKAEELVAWVYHPGTQVKLYGPAYQIISLPEPSQMIQLILLSREEGCAWALLDGPRAASSNWMLDLNWEDQPEMPQKLLEQSQARCVKLTDLAAALDEYIQQ